MNLLVINDGGMVGGGAETRLTELLDHWYKKKSLSSVHFLQREESKAVLNQPYIQSSLASNHKKTREAYIQELCVQKKIDLVQVHNILDSGPIVFSFIKNYGIPVVWWVHDFWGFCGTRLLNTTANERCDGPTLIKCTQCIGFKSMLRVRLFRPHFTAVDLGISQSQHMINLHHRFKIKPKAWEVVTPWIKSEIFSQTSRVPLNPIPTVLFIGPLTQTKGADLAIETFAKISEQMPDVKFQMVGGEPQHGTWAKDLAKNLKIESKVEFIPRVSQEKVAEYLATASLLLFTTRGQEPFGLTWQQALAVGCPLVTVETGSILETIDQSMSIICKLDSSELANGALRVLRDPVLSRKMGEASSKFALKKFNLSTAADKLEKAYKHLLSNRT